ncbi:MAG: glycosyltransferase family 39 protein [Flavobacteriales bacterium]|nr:glycosyltransferase family 39 protein [Flavobacteriales bacterium]
MDRSLTIQLIAIMVVVLLGAGLDVMEVDAAQYAGMSRDMLVSGDVLELHYRGEDYLDKPPLLFWMSALSFGLFGVHDWSYRLPSIVFAFLGAFSTYRFALLYHGKEVARTALVMFGCSLAFFLMCNDVRCDTMLTGSVITAIWSGCAWLKEGRWWQLFTLALSLSCGLLSKGPIGAMAPMLAIGAQSVFTRSWVRLRDPRWLLVPVIVALALIPMCIGLYQQHGWHGIRFYFWEQSFGRITGENRWQDDSSALFFTHELLWQMLPWTVFVLAGLWRAGRMIMRRKAPAEYASSIGAFAVFVALSLSHFKLPHYLYVTLPLFAVLGAYGRHSAQGFWLFRVQAVVTSLIWILTLVLAWVPFPELRWPMTGLVLVLGMVALWSARASDKREAALVPTFWVMIAAGAVLNGQFYPGVLRSQANAQAGKWAAANGSGPRQFFGMQVSGNALDYYAGFPVQWLSHAGEARSVIVPGVAIYTDEIHRKELMDAGLAPVREIELYDHPAQRLSLRFVLPHLRATVLEKRYIMVY